MYIDIQFDLIIYLNIYDSCYVMSLKQFLAYRSNDAKTSSKQQA